MGHVSSNVDQMDIELQMEHVSVFQDTLKMHSIDVSSLITVELIKSLILQVDNVSVLRVIYSRGISV